MARTRKTLAQIKIQIKDMIAFNKKQKAKNTKLRKELAMLRKKPLGRSAEISHKKRMLVDQVRNLKTGKDLLVTFKKEKKEILARKKKTKK